MSKSGQHVTIIVYVIYKTNKLRTYKCLTIISIGTLICAN